MSHFNSWHQVGPLLDAAALADMIPRSGRVMIKPNLVADQPPPMTTPVGLVAEIIHYLQAARPDCEIIVGDGCGSLKYDTHHVFSSLGYRAMADEAGVSLLDLNEESLRRLANDQFRRWPVLYLPEVVLDSFLISVPVLKAHSMAGLTLTMKNMMGAAPPAYYQQDGHWRKASFHEDIQNAVFDLNRYRTPDFTVLDATVGMPEAHLWGPVCEPPKNRLAVSADPVAIDAYGAMLLGVDWRGVGHIAMAHGVLGVADPLMVCEI